MLLKHIDLLSRIKIGTQLISSNLDFCFSCWRIRISLIVCIFFLCRRLFNELLINDSSFRISNISYWFVFWRTKRFWFGNILNETSTLNFDSLDPFLFILFRSLSLILWSCRLHLSLISCRMLSKAFRWSWLI